MIPMTTRRFATAAGLLGLFALAGCSVDLGNSSPAGSPPAMRLNMVTATSDLSVAAGVDLVVAEASIRVVLPPVADAGNGRIVTLRCAAACTALSVAAAGGERIEDDATMALEGGDMVSLAAVVPGRWVVISVSDL